MARSKVNIGDVYGRLTVVRDWGRDKGKNIKWMCLCKCGNTSVVLASSLKRGSTQSCGCLQKEVSVNCHTRHGKHDTKVYRAWRNMLDRCKNKCNTSYERYGARGVHVCDEWDPDKGGSFEAFYGCMGDPSEGESLDKDLRGGIGCLIYSPDTCSWQTAITQASHTRQVRWLELDGKRQSLSQWSRDLCVAKELLSGRLRSGWSVREALLTPKGGDRTQFAAS